MQEQKILTTSKRLLAMANRYKKVADYLDMQYLKSKEKHYYVTPLELTKALKFYEPKNPIVMSMDTPHNSIYGFFSPILHACCAYRISPISYAIDPDYKQEIKPIHLDTPASIFSKIPHVTFYLEFPVGDVHQGFLITKLKEKDGIWLSINGLPSEDEAKRMQAKFEDKLKKDVPVLFNLSFGLNISNDKTIRDRFKNLAAELNLDLMKPADKVIHDGFVNSITEILSVLLWFCVQEPDISDFEGKVLTVNEVRKLVIARNKAGVFIPPSKPVLRLIGGQLGGEIRKFRAIIADSDKSDNQEKTLLPIRTVRPHIRAGHWHGYWMGQKDNKEYTVKWVNATLVNAKLSA